MFDVLGNRPYVCGDGHVVVVAFPAGYDMKMQMVIYSCPGYLADVESDVKTVGSKVIREYPAAVLEHGHDSRVFFFI